MEKAYDIVFDNVSFSYSTSSLLEHVDLKIKKGEFASIVGPNGGGKSTLLKLVVGFLKPDSGRITVFDKSPEKARLNVGYMPQYTQLDIQFPVTVFDVVLMGRLGNSFGGRYSKKDREEAENSLDQVKLLDLKNRHFDELSGGQRQRVLIARALCTDPALLLLDEPSANIDKEIEKSLIHILTDLNKHMTILLVSHDIGFISQVVKSVICVNRFVRIHPTSELNGGVIRELYGDDLRMIRHDHRCSEGGHYCD